MSKPGDSDVQMQGSPSSGAGAFPIPDKLYFRIGEVAALCRVPTHVLRFWQTEFAQLRPSKSGTGQRLYRRRDVEMALRIKRLLHEEGYTIAGARGVLLGENTPPATAPQQADPPGAEPAQLAIATVRGELREVLRLLERPLPTAVKNDSGPQLVLPEGSPPRE